MIAFEQWPVQGVPDGPGAWLMATAKHRAIDLIRRRASYERKLQEIGRDAALRPEYSGEPDVDAMDDHIGDDLLRLIFISCHPVLSPEARAALTLRLLGGLTTAEIARAFLVPEATIAQRIVRDAVNSRFHCVGRASGRMPILRGSGGGRGAVGRGQGPGRIDQRVRRRGPRPAGWLRRCPRAGPAAA